MPLQLKEVSINNSTLTTRLLQCNAVERFHRIREAAREAGIPGLQEGYRTAQGAIFFHVPAGVPEVNIETFAARLRRKFEPVIPRPYGFGRF